MQGRCQPHRGLPALFPSIAPTDPRPHQGSLENVKVDPKEMQLALAGFLDKHTAGFMRRCAVIAAGPYTPIHPLTSPYTPLQQPAHPPRSPPSPRPFCPLHESRRLESHRHRSCQVRGWRTRDRK